MSSQKKQSIWKRLKQLLTDTANVRSDDKASAHHKDVKNTDKTTSSVVDNTGSDFHNDTEDASLIAQEGQNTSYANPHRESIDSVDLNIQKQAAESESKKQDESSSAKQPSKFVSLSNLDASDNMKRRSSSYKNSDKPITDAILDFLEASDLSYYYHHQHEQNPKDNSSDAQSNSLNDQSKQQTSESESTASQSSTVHHISMAMRYFNDTDNDSNDDVSGASAASNHNEPLDDSLDDLTTSNLNNLEWGCVIRVHEHTQLVAIYGVLPFQLPPSHLQAGVTLATQLNYDMMLGSIEIDIRDGEIRLKNSLDLEPIINTSGGIVPPAVISYLLKGLMAMTASFAPLFHDLINSDPKKFELEHLLEQLQKERADNSFFLATTTPQ